MENALDLLLEYHRRIGEINLAAAQTPFRISKQIWKLHAEMSGRLILVASEGAGSESTARPSPEP